MGAAERNKWLDHIYSRNARAYEVIGFWVAKSRLSLKVNKEADIKQ